MFVVLAMIAVAAATWGASDRGDPIGPRQWAGSVGSFKSVSSKRPKLRKIVVLKPRVSEKAVEEHVEDVGGVETKDLDVANSMAVQVPDQAAARELAADPRVARVEDDVMVKAISGEGNGLTPVVPVVTTLAQSLPWGVNKVDAEKVWSRTTGDPIKVAIIDTGIDRSHPDLLGNIKGGVSKVWYTRNYNDDNGHGTHVAGTVAAVSNSIGVIGVAPKADLYGVKVLDNYGSGYLSDVIAGIDWAVANRMKVINMSLGTSYHSSSLENAVKRANSAGITLVCAAGNSGPYSNSVVYPGKFSQVICVGATASDDTIAYFSSRGPQVDVSAPGYYVYSTYKGRTYATLSGTSMATPHVAGAVALVLTRPIGTYDSNHNGRWDPAEVRSRLQRTSLDLGTRGFDTAYGYGRIRANLAAGVP